MQGVSASGGCGGVSRPPSFAVPPHPPGCPVSSQYGPLQGASRPRVGRSPGRFSPLGPTGLSSMPTPQPVARLTLRFVLGCGSCRACSGPTKRERLPDKRSDAIGRPGYVDLGRPCCPLVQSFTWMLSHRWATPRTSPRAGLCSATLPRNPGSGSQGRRGHLAHEVHVTRPGTRLTAPKAGTSRASDGPCAGRKVYLLFIAARDGLASSRSNAYPTPWRTARYPQADGLLGQHSPAVGRLPSGPSALPSSHGGGAGC